MPDPAPSPPDKATVTLPFFTITVLANGQFQSQTNLKDKSLILGLLETAKFQVMLAPPDKPVVQKPHDGFAEGLLRKMRG